MRITALAPVAVDILEYEAPEATTTVVIKAAFRLTQAGFALEEPDALCNDVPGDGTELHYASDWVPSKSMAEVLVVGNARAAEPTRSIPVRIAIGAIDKRCLAMAGAAVSSVPLSSTYLRTADGAPVRVGPLPATDPSWESGQLASGFDNAAFNAAPRDQRLARLEPGAALVLEGLIRGAPVIHTQLPSWRPTAFIVTSRHADEGWRRVQLACDTLWIDTDSATAVLVWRAMFPSIAAEIIVDGGDRDLRRGDLVSHLPAGDWAPSSVGPLSTAEAETLVADPESPDSAAQDSRSHQMSTDVAQDSHSERGARRPSLEEGTAVLDLSDLRASAASLPFVPGNGKPPPPPIERAPPSAGRTTASEETTALHVALGPALPFAPSSDAPPPSTRAARAEPASTSRPPGRLREATITVETVAAGEALPFARGKLPAHVASALAGLSADAPAGGTIVANPGAAADALPFDRGRTQLPSNLPANPDLPFAPRHVRPPAPNIPPPAEAPAPQSTSAHVVVAPTLPLDILASIKAALLDGVPLGKAVEQASVSERAFRLAERQLAIDLARQSAQGQSELSRQLEAAIAAARSRTPPPNDRKGDEDDLDGYVMARAEIEEADDPLEALAELGLSESKWEDLRRSWTRRALADPAIAATLRERLATARKSLRRLGPEH